MVMVCKANEKNSNIVLPELFETQHGAGAIID